MRFRMISVPEPATIGLIAGILVVIAGYLVQKKQDNEDEKSKKAIQQQLTESRKELKINAEEAKRNDKEVKRNAEEAKKKAEEYANKIDKYATVQLIKSGEIITLQRDVIAKSEENSILTRKLAELQNKVDKTSTETLDNITSKDSYCLAEIEISPDPRVNSARITIIHHGLYPLKNVEVSIVNTDANYPYKSLPDAPPDQLTDITNNFGEDSQKYHLIDHPYVKKN